MRDTISRRLNDEFFPSILRKRQSAMHFQRDQAPEITKIRQRLTCWHSTVAFGTLAKSFLWNLKFGSITRYLLTRG